MSVIGPQAQAQVAVPPRVGPLEGGSRLEWVLMHVAFLAVTIFFLAPFVWLFTASFDAHLRIWASVDSSCWPNTFTSSGFISLSPLAMLQAFHQ